MVSSFGMVRNVDYMKSELSNNRYRHMDEFNLVKNIFYIFLVTSSSIVILENSIVEPSAHERLLIKLRNSR